MGTRERFVGTPAWDELEARMAAHAARVDASNAVDEGPEVAAPVRVDDVAGRAAA